MHGHYSVTILLDETQVEWLYYEVPNYGSASIQIVEYLSSIHYFTIEAIGGRFTSANRSHPFCHEQYIQILALMVVRC